MVLRPTLLRYKGSAKKVDSAKMQQIAKRTQENVQQIERMQLGSKTAVGLCLIAFTVFMSKSFCACLPTRLTELIAVCASSYCVHDVAEYSGERVNR